MVVKRNIVGCGMHQVYSINDRSRQWIMLAAVGSNNAADPSSSFLATLKSNLMSIWPCALSHGDTLMSSNNNRGHYQSAIRWWHGNYSVMLLSTIRHRHCPHMIAKGETCNAFRVVLFLGFVDRRGSTRSFDAFASSKARFFGGATQPPMTTVH